MLLSGISWVLPGEFAFKSSCTGRCVMPCSQGAVSETNGSINRGCHAFNYTCAPHVLQRVCAATALEEEVDVVALLPCPLPDEGTLAIIS